VLPDGCRPWTRARLHSIDNPVQDDFFTLQRRPQEKNRKVLAIGNPDLGNRSLDLPFAEREAATLRWNFPDLTLLTREKATESWVRTHINEFGIIHLASHGEFDPINPLFSSVRLARDPANDGRLEAEEIFGLDLKADLVVLSACQTGLGDLQRYHQLNAVSSLTQL